MKWPNDFINKIICASAVDVMKKNTQQLGLSGDYFASI